MAVTSEAGVTSNAGFRAGKRSLTSTGSRSSMGIAAPAGRREVDRRARRHDVEGNAVTVREHGQRVRADLVRRVPVGRDAVGAGEDGVHLAAGDERPGRGVGDDAVGDAGALQLPRGQARALEERPRLVHEHVRDEPPLEALADRPERAAHPAGGERPGVAVRERTRPGLEQAGRVGGHPAAALDLLRVQRTRPLGELGRALLAPAHLGERPGQVHRSRPGGERARRAARSRSSPWAAARA